MKIETFTHYVEILPSNIIIATTRPDFTDVFTKEHAMTFVKIIEEYSIDRRPGAIIVASNGKMTTEARQVVKEYGDRCSCLAIVGKSLMAQLMGNMFLGVYKPKTPVKLFKNTEVAMKWTLEKMKDQNES